MNKETVVLGGVEYEAKDLAVAIALASLKHDWNVLNEGRLFACDGAELNGDSVVPVANELAVIHNVILDGSGLEGMPLAERRMPHLALVRAEADKKARLTMEEGGRSP